MFLKFGVRFLVAVVVDEIVTVGHESGEVVVIVVVVVVD